ncbi:MAG: DUF3365 domain-containing protein [Flavobacteriales bacterium]|nr:DUF3365 domain-containing protein [Flavobacteriales bacterium]
MISFVLVGFASCTATAPLDETAALEKGKRITSATFQALSARLSAAMQAGGPARAVEYCSLNALPLVDSISVAEGVHIKRTSDRLRAVHDSPDADEKRALQVMLDQWAQGNAGTVLSDVRMLGDSVAYYQPILIASPTCLKCHGTAGLDLDSNAFAVITQHYPEDAATGYALGELRGMWSIRWKN